MGTPLEAGVFRLEIPSYPAALIDGTKGEPKQTVWETESTQQYELGTKLEYSDGRKFRYCKAGSVDLSKAYMTAGEAAYARSVDELQATSGTAVEVGDVEIVVDVTTGGSWTDDAYAGGFVVVNKATGIGDIYKVLASEINASDDTLLTIRLESPIRTALDATSELTFCKAPWRDVVVAPTTAAGIPTGVPLVDVTGTYYFWGQTGGAAPIYVDTGDTIVAGEPAGKPGTHADAGAVGLVANDGTDLVYGQVIYPATAGEVAIIYLTLD